MGHAAIFVRYFLDMVSESTSDRLPKKSLPEAVQRVLVKFYECCGNAKKKDKNTLMKHRLTNKHFTHAVAGSALNVQPVATCPAFLSMHGLCRNAKYVSPFALPFFAFISSVLTVAFRPGRYDSSKRHCDDCAGFKKIGAKCQQSGMAITPVQITRGEFLAVQEFRRNVRSGQEPYAEPVLNAVFKLFAMMATSETGSIAIKTSEGPAPSRPTSTQG
jgi:hypothetical protein